MALERHRRLRPLQQRHHHRARPERLGLPGRRLGRRSHAQPVRQHPAATAGPQLARHRPFDLELGHRRGRPGRHPAEAPAGSVSTTFKAGADTQTQDSRSTCNGAVVDRDISRTTGSLQASVSVPITSRWQGRAAGAGRPVAQLQRPVRATVRFRRPDHPGRRAPTGRRSIRSASSSATPTRKAPQRLATERSHPVDAQRLDLRLQEQSDRTGHAHRGRQPQPSLRQPPGDEAERHRPAAAQGRQDQPADQRQLHGHAGRRLDQRLPGHHRRHRAGLPRPHPSATPRAT